jgi:peptidoglycan/LPS O-acetylase OafA/YrhL
LRQSNNFNALRLGAALLVLLSHSFPLAYGSDGAEPLFRISKGQTTLGHISVMIFFAVSGYLITGSFTRSRSPARFVVARVLRLYPALTVVLVVLAMGLGPLVTRLSLLQYFSTFTPYRYVAANLVFLFNDHLPGVFEHVPYARAVDGSLWTLHYEVVCYIAVLALGLMRVLRGPVVFGALVLCVIGEHFRLGGDYAALGLPFAAGALICLTDLPLRRDAALGCAVLCLVSLFSGGFSIVAGLFGAYLAVTIGASPARLIPDPAHKIGDLSYGTYVWAFPVQQLAASCLGSSVTWWGIAALSFVPTMVLGWLSWHLIESPILALKPRRSQGLATVGVNAEPDAKALRAEG